MLNERHGNDLDKMIKDLFKVDEQLYKSFLLAQSEIKDEDIPPASEDSFEKLMIKVEERGIEPIIHSQDTAVNISNDFPNSSYVSRRRPRRTRLHTVIRIGFTVAILTVLMVGMGITTSAKKRYLFNVSERNLETMGVNITYNKGTTDFSEDRLEEAYEQIRTKLGIDVLKLSYIPAGMRLDELSVSNTLAMMTFSLDGNIIYLRERKIQNGSSYNLVSDCTPYKIVYNDYLMMDVPISMNDLGDGVQEFSVQITIQDSLYEIDGIINEKEFERIVKYLYVDERIRR